MRYQKNCKCSFLTVCFVIPTRTAQKIGIGCTQS